MALTPKERPMFLLQSNWPLLQELPQTEKETEIGGQK